jgi:hypothetical protein
MDTNIAEQLKNIEAKLDVVQVDVQKTRRYLQIITWVTVLMVVLPAVGLIIVIPMFINLYTSSLGGLL